MVPREDLLGLERANTELGGRGGGAGTAANGAQGSVQPKCYRALDGKSSTNHGHKCGDVIREEGPGSGIDRGDQGLILGVCKNEKLLGPFDEGFEEGIKSGFNVAPLGPRNLLGNSETTLDTEK